MRVTVTTLSDDIFNLDVSEDLELENFKAFCEVESGIPAAEINLLFNGKVMEDGAKSLKSHGLKEGDVVVIQRQTAATSHQQQGIGLPLLFTFFKSVFCQIFSFQILHLIWTLVLYKYLHLQGRVETQTAMKMILSLLETCF